MSLVYETLILAVLTAIVIWQIKGSKKIDKPKETEDGKFSIPKPEDEFMGKIECDEIRIDQELKGDNYEAIPNPSAPKPKGTIK